MAMNSKKKNIFLSKTVERMPYISDSHPIERRYPQRITLSHAEYIRRKLNECYKESLSSKQVAAIREKDGLYLEFSSANNYDLAIKSLDNRNEGIKLLNVHENESTIKATVFIPRGKENYFIRKVDAYATEITKSGKPKNNDLVSSIEDIKLAVLESFWIGKPDSMPRETPMWCEIWLRFDYLRDNTNTVEVVENSITSVCSNFAIQIDDKRLVFPERIVKMVFANAEDLKNIISMCPFITEIRNAPTANYFFENLINSEQKEWINDLLARTSYDTDSTSICLLDTGISSGHPLLKPAIKINHIQSVNSNWGNGDFDGHGTEMAGIALFYDIKECLESNNKVFVNHEIESVRILPPSGENRPDLYGAITEQAVAMAEISNPESKRVICMSITAPDINTFDGSPTSWSATIDNITSGANEENEKRLFIISAGNVYPSELKKVGYPEINMLHGVENPGQSWNAITIGAYTKDSVIDDPFYNGYYPLASFGGLSPYSSSSVMWSNKWPIKPEVLFDGGNMAFNGNDYTDCPDLSLITTYYRPLVKQFSTIWGTSSAAAQAAWFCSQIINEYPYIWPETVRALMIHSASWTEEMKRQFCVEDTKTKGRRRLLRTCGYGIPNLNKAIQCMDNSVNMIIQSELQPYDKKRMKEMHMHTLPWPKDVLRSLGDVPVTLKVTLSYFIEPGPGEVGWKDKYRYPSCGLRFDVINSDETINDFKKRINKKMRDEKGDKGEGTSGSERWYLGSDNRDVGSIHSDYCELNAVDLCECNYIAVYPVIGWWRERTYLKQYDKKVRYSLVVSLSTPKIDVDLYTPIVSQIANSIEVNVMSS